MLDINFDNLKFSIRPASRFVEEGGGPYMDWLDVDVEVVQGFFSGRVKWSVMPIEIVEFKNSLTALHSSLISGKNDIKTVDFSGVEPNFSLRIMLANAWGHLVAEYNLHESPDGPQLKGSFGLDQSFLQQWIRDLDGLLEYRG